MSETLIISIKDFRTITGEATAHFTDEQVVEIIRQLDILAQMHIKNMRAGKEVANKVKDQK